MKIATQEADVVFLGFALSECTVKLEPHSVKYLRVIHRSALGLAIQNRFGLEIGGFWLTTEQIAELRAISDFYPPQEASLVAEALEAYLSAQLEGIPFVTQLV